MAEKKVRYARISERDNIALALVDLKKDEDIVIGEIMFRLVGDIPYRHKFCVRAIAEGEPVIKKGERIGAATREIVPGEHVHIHNMKGFV